MGCEQLATKAELEALRSELKMLLGRKLDQSEKSQIIQAGALQGKELALTVVGALLSGYTLLSQHKSLQGTVGNLDAKTNVLGNRIFSAESDAKRAAAEANLAKARAEAARQLGSRAIGEAQSAKGLAGKANALAERVARVLGAVNNKIDDATRRFGQLFNALDSKLGGVLSQLGRLAGRVADLLGKVFFILDVLATITTVAQLMALTERVSIIEGQINQFNSELNRLQRSVFNIFAKLKSLEMNLSAQANNALTQAILAFNTASSALSAAMGAEGQAARSLSYSIEAAKNAAIASAVATATSAAVSGLLSRVTSIGRRADDALTTANRAERKADDALRSPSGRTIVERPITKIERYYTRETVIQKGEPGPPGPMGPAGRDGKDGKDVNPADLSEIKRLLYRIDSTTTRTDGTTSANLVISATTNSKVGFIESTLIGLNNFIEKAFRATRMDKVLNALNFILLLHNAAMLSRNLASTLGDLTSQALAVIGIKDENDSPIDINSVLSNQADAFMKSLVGEEIWTGVKESWNKASRIISSATNIVWTIRSLTDSAREILEWTAENTGKIGNALKRYRVVGENAYKWMPEQVTMTNAWTRKIDRVREQIDSLDDAASSLSSVLGEVQNIQEEFNQLNEQKQQFEENLKALTPKPREDNEPVKEKRNDEKQASAAPAQIAEVFRGEGETSNA